ncbi:hypothetical protein [Glutamicibacter ardleyensis]|uniref:hypothetical protein n=1 Tax=Glutamicibacter ardleyensis TaxID=225894 RepID=UPI003FD158E5
MTTTTVNTTHTRENYLSITGQDFYPDFTGLPTIDELFDNDAPLEGDTVFAHYFAPGYDFWLMALDTDTGIAYGKVRMADSEFGTVRLQELCTANIQGFPVEREVDTTSSFRAFMKPKPLAQFHTGMDAPSNGSVRWF